MKTALAQAITEKLGREVRTLHEVHGGDIHAAFRVELTGGDSVFVKSSANAPRGMFTAEARGLAWLREPGALCIPEVVGVADGEEGPRYLLLEWLEASPRNPRFDEKLGHGLAQIHRAGATSFGLDHDNFIGSLPQSNRAHATWTEFYRDERLLPLVEKAAQAGLLDRTTRSDFDLLFAGLPALIGHVPAPARLHGDLWGGNLHGDAAGEPCLLDPAVYGGDREVDLAMMRLFGGFGARVFAAYDEAWPLAEGHEARVPLYQLYPLLVHVNLFGRSYTGQVRRALSNVLKRA